MSKERPESICPNCGAEMSHFAGFDVETTEDNWWCDNCETYHAPHEPDIDERRDMWQEQTQLRAQVKQLQELNSAQELLVKTLQTVNAGQARQIKELEAHRDYLKMQMNVEREFYRAEIARLKQATRK